MQKNNSYSYDEPELDKRRQGIKYKLYIKVYSSYMIMP